MLVEISRLRQSDRSLVKRWFTCCDMDLFVWTHNKERRIPWGHRTWYGKKWLRKTRTHDNRPTHFQLSFNKQGNELAISWNQQRGFSLYQVNSGETTPNRYKKTPLLLDTFAQQDLFAIARNFLVASENIDTAVADFIYARLIENL